jgi:hypothetical protein
MPRIPQTGPLDNKVETENSSGCLEQHGNSHRLYEGGLPLC